MSRSVPFIWAHRGCSNQAPENSEASWTFAAQKGYALEGDFWPSSDGILFNCHDSTVDRTTNGTGAISTLTSAQLAALDNGSKFNPEGFALSRMKTAAQMFATAKLYNAWVIPENNDGTLASGRLLVSEAKKAGVISKMVYQQFDAPLTVVPTICAENPGLPVILLLTTGATPASAATYKATGITWIGPNIDDAYVTLAWVQSMQALGISVAPYTVDTLAQYAKAISVGVDAIFTSYPDLMNLGLASPGTFREEFDPDTTGNPNWLWGDDWIRDSFNYWDSNGPRPFAGYVEPNAVATNQLGGAVCIRRPLPTSGRFRLDTTVNLQAANADATRWFAIQILQQDLLIKAFAPVPVGSNGYGFVIRQNGTIEIGKYTSGIASATIASKVGAALGVGVDVPISIIIDDNNLTFIRNDTGGSITVADNSFRGGKLGLMWSTTGMRCGPIYGS